MRGGASARVKLFAIGNSKGVRIPRALAKACGFGGEVEMQVDDGVISLTPVRNAREGWDAAYARMAAEGDDARTVDKSRLLEKLERLPQACARKVAGVLVEMFSHA